MATAEYFEKKQKIDDLLELTQLKIECLSPKFSLVKKVNTIDKAIDFASSNIVNKYSRLKDVSICIDEIGWTYYSKFSPIDFEDELIEKLEDYVKKNSIIKN